MIATLTRYYTPLNECVLGELVFDEAAFVTVECPWLNNKRSKSCIPEGVYECRRYSSQRYPYTFEITNVPERDYILFHKGNTPKDIEGCIAVGTSFYSNLSGVAESKKAFKRFMRYLEDVDSFSLHIIPFTADYP